MGMGFAPTSLRQVSPPPLLHKSTLTTDPSGNAPSVFYYVCTGISFLLLANYKYSSSSSSCNYDSTSIRPREIRLTTDVTKVHVTVRA